MRYHTYVAREGSSPARPLLRCSFPLTLTAPARFSFRSVAHPFLLADNRHYAFYLWRRVINVHPYARYALAPGYVVAARLLWIQLGWSLPHSHDARVFPCFVG